MGKNRYVRHSKNLSSGFSLIELLVVLVIIGLLASMVIMKLDPLSKGAEENIADSELKKIKKAIVGSKDFLTGYYHETRLPQNLNQKLPMTIPCLVSLTEEIKENPGQPVEIFDWDPNHSRGYRPGGYLKGEAQVDASSPVTLMDPWDSPYEIFVDPSGDMTLHKVYSLGPDKVDGTSDDRDVYLFKEL